MAVQLSAEDYCIIYVEEALAASALMTLEENVRNWLADNPGWQPCGGPSVTFQSETDDYIVTQAFVTMERR
jgi:hypothetical protein